MKGYSRAGMKCQCGAIVEPAPSISNCYYLICVECEKCRPSGTAAQAQLSEIDGEPRDEWKARSSASAASDEPRFTGELTYAGSPVLADVLAKLAQLDAELPDGSGLAPYVGWIEQAVARDPDLLTYLAALAIQQAVKLRAAQ